MEPLPTASKHAMVVAAALFKIKLFYFEFKAINILSFNLLTTQYHSQVFMSFNVHWLLVSTIIPCYIILQANGLDERCNQTLQQMLVKFVAERRKMWEEFLDTSVVSYNTSKHYSSKYVLAYCNKVKYIFLTDTILLCTDLLLLK